MERARGQLEWEFTGKTFATAYLDYEEIENHFFAAEFSLPAGTEELKRLRDRNRAGLATDDMLDFISSPEFDEGEITSGGLAVNQILAEQLSCYARYLYIDAENTGAAFAGNQLPKLPEHTVALGATWVSPLRVYLIAQATYRDTYFLDEANSASVDAGWDVSMDFFWESREKSIQIRFGVDDWLDDDAPTFYSMDVNFRF